MQKISKSLEELVQEKLLSKKAADIAPNTPQNPNSANAAPKTSTMEAGTYYLEPSKDDPNKMVGKVWGKRPTDPEAAKKYQETFERTYAINNPLQKATQRWGQNIGYGKNYTDSAQTANRKLRQEEISGVENVDQAGDSTFTKLRKGWNRAKAQNNLPEMRRYQEQMNTTLADYAKRSGMTMEEVLGKLSPEQRAQINIENIQAMNPNMQRYSVTRDPTSGETKVTDLFAGFAGAKVDNAAQDAAIKAFNEKNKPTQPTRSFATSDVRNFQNTMSNLRNWTNGNQVAQQNQPQQKVWDTSKLITNVEQKNQRYQKRTKADGSMELYDTITKKSYPYNRQNGNQVAQQNTMFVDNVAEQLGDTALRFPI